MKKTTPSDGFCGDLFVAIAPAETAAGLPVATTPELVPESGDVSAADLERLFARLAKSAFRSRFRLSRRDVDYIRAKGLDTIRRHAADFIRTRLAPAVIPNDGRQTPMRGHPVFLAQHATACCCRGCLAKWHAIPAGRPLTPAEQRYAVAVVMAWIARQEARSAGADGE